MAKDAFYFKHDYGARNDPKMVRLIRLHGWQAFGLAWAIIEILYEQGGRISHDPEHLAYEFRTEQALIEAILASPIFFIIDGMIGSESVDRRLDERRAISEAARVASESRWNARAMRPHDNRNPRRGEERRREDKRPSSAGADGASIDFENFWQAFPRKVGKGAALKLWKRLGPSQELQARIIAAVGSQRQSDQWRREDGRFIPHPATWLNQGRWDDEVSADLAARSVTPGKRPWACDSCGSKTNEKSKAWGGAICAPCEKEKF